MFPKLSLRIHPLSFGSFLPSLPRLGRDKRRSGRASAGIRRPLSSAPTKPALILVRFRKGRRIRPREFRLGVCFCLLAIFGDQELADQRNAAGERDEEKILQ